MSTRKTLLLMLLCLMGSLITLPSSAQKKDAFHEPAYKADLFRDIGVEASKMIYALYEKCSSPIEHFYRSRRMMTRYEAIRYITRFIERIDQESKDKSPNKKPTFTKEDTRVIGGFVGEYEKEIEQYKKLNKSFTLKPGEIYAILDTVPPFLDVPPTHWAFSAVQALKEADIIEGYPTQGKNTFLYHAPKH